MQVSMSFIQVTAAMQHRGACCTVTYSICLSCLINWVRNNLRPFVSLLPTLTCSLFALFLVPKIVFFGKYGQF